ncbi:MAG TPA: T9SS type A sorting domain-containing protein [Candidatus Kapabacteria bacterium]|nr:T9SS type A sorting domain-containing protein [Candidatus Kapabacteria bacterium]
MKTSVSTIGKCICTTVVVILTSLLCFGSVHAQWSEVATNLLGKQDYQMGAIFHRGGVAWAGSHQVIWMSADSGAHWSLKFNENLGNDYINDINFFDEKTGIFCTHNGDVFLTTDQGTSWKLIHSSRGAVSGAFLANANTILVATGSGATVDATQDGGNTWTQVTLGNFVPCVKPLLGNSALTLAGNDPIAIYKTTDAGLSWTPTAGKIGFDTYSFDVVPCEGDHIVAVNEACNVSHNQLTQIFITNDGGNTWAVSNSQPLTAKSSSYFCGSVSMTTRAIFVQTTQNGVLRSTDQGATWQNIGGPSAIFDTRLVFAISPNIILAADSNGSIWRTINSGGDSITNIKPYEGLTITPPDLFGGDTLTNCDSPVVGISRFRALLCSFPKIDTQFVSGPDSLDYAIVKGIKDSLGSSDSIVLAFRPRGSGERNANYVLVLIDGTRIIVPLSGAGRNITFVEPVSKSVTVDTIGGFAHVPIQLRGFVKKESLDLLLHYDPKLRYSGCYSLGGKRLDDPSVSWAGRSKIHLDTADLRLDTISANAVFTVFPDGDSCFAVSIDSLTILNPLAPCLYSIGDGVPVQVCPPRGCSIMTLTNFLLHRWRPKVYIMPNPSSGSLSLYSEKDIGNSSISVTNDLGNVVRSSEKNILAGENRILETGLPTGHYIVTVSSADQSYTADFVVSK